MHVSQIKKSIVHEIKNNSSEYLSLILDDITQLESDNSTSISIVNENTPVTILESIRIHLTTNIKNYNFYVVDAMKFHDTIGDNYIMHRTFTEYDLVHNDIRKIISQINTMEFSGEPKSICTDYPLDSSIKNIIFVVTQKNYFLKRKQSIMKINDEKSINLMMGIETIKMIKHQRLDRICQYYLKKKSDVVKSLEIFDDFHRYYKKLPYDIQKRIILISGVILHSLGTTYTADIDIIYMNNDTIDDAMINDVAKKLSMFSGLDYHIIYNGNVLKKNNSQMTYMYEWLYNNWPRLSGAKNLDEVFHNPIHHYFYLGIKYISVDLTIKRIASRSANTGFVDLLSLQKFNGYKINICFPNMSIRQGQIAIYDDSQIKKSISKIQYYFQQWHKNNITTDELKKKIPRCTYTSKFFNRDITNVNAIQVTKYMDHNIQYLSKKYPNNILVDYKYVLDHDINMDEIFSIIQNDTDTVILYDCIKYLMPDLNHVMKIIVSHPNIRRVLFSCNDYGSYNYKTKNIIYEVRDQDELIYGVYHFHQESQSHKKIIVYFNDVYNQHQGSVEYMVSTQTCINIMQHHNFNLKYNEMMIDFHRRENIPLNSVQSEIIKFQRLVCMEKIL